jgi:excisionase family DNA binding protein
LKEVMKVKSKIDGVEPLLLRVEEVAQLLGIARSTVYALIAAGDLPVVRIGRVTRVARHALAGWIEEHTDDFRKRAA